MAVQFPYFNGEPDTADWRREVERRLRVDDSRISALSNRVKLQQSSALAQARGVAAQNNNPGSVITRGSDIFFSRNYSTTIPPDSADYVRVVVGDPANLDYSKYTSLSMTYTFSTFGTRTLDIVPSGPFAFEAVVELYSPDTDEFLTVGTNVPGTVAWVADRITGGSLVNRQVLHSWYFQLSDFLGYNDEYTQIRPVFRVANLSNATPNSVTSLISGSTIAYYRSDYWSNS